MPWIISGLVTGGIALARFLWKRKALTGTAIAAGTLGYDIGSAGKKPGGGPSPGPSLAWLLLLPVMGFVVWFVLRKPGKAKNDVDFYAGALGLDPAVAAKCSREYLAGKLSKQKRDEKWANNPEVAGLKATGISMQFGKKWEGNRGTY